jgi:hypothetical protein
VDVVDWIERIPVDETRDYVKRTLENLQVYRARLGSPEMRLERDMTGEPGDWPDPLGIAASKRRLAEIPAALEPARSSAGKVLSDSRNAPAACGRCSDQRATATALQPGHQTAKHAAVSDKRLPRLPQEVHARSAAKARRTPDARPASKPGAAPKAQHKANRT